MPSQSSLKSRIRSGEPTIGSWLCLGNASIVEILADAGFDWMVVDLEHSTTTMREAAEMIRVADLKGVPPIVRLSGHDWNQAKRMLDAGARGIIVPMVSNGEEARTAARRLRYPPAGERGVGLGRAQRFGPGFDDYVVREPETILVAQIEHASAVRGLEGILDVQELDATIIGPYDLSGSVGKPGKLDDVEVASLLQRYEKICKARKAAMGFHIVSPDHDKVREKLAAGYSFLAFSVDFMFLGEMARRELASVRRLPELTQGR